MKVTTIGRSNLSRIFFVLAAVGAVYFYRRQGGSIRALWHRGVDMISPVADQLMHRTSDVASSAAPNATI